MKKESWISKNKALFVGILVAAVGIVLALGNEFLFKADEGGITGAQAIKQLGGQFWGWLALASVASGVGTWFLVKKLKQEGGYGVGYGAVIAILLPLCIVLGKACESKADGGVTTPKGRPEQVAKDSNRVAAEDLLPKK